MWVCPGSEADIIMATIIPFAVLFYLVNWWPAWLYNLVLRTDAASKEVHRRRGSALQSCSTLLLVAVCMHCVVSLLCCMRSTFTC